jgi:hypothetical protein
MMKIWQLEYFNIGSGTHTVGFWSSQPSIEQLCAASVDINEDIALELLVDGSCDQDYNLNEVEIGPGHG